MELIQGKYYWEAVSLLGNSSFQLLEETCIDSTQDAPSTFWARALTDLLGEVK